MLEDKFRHYINDHALVKPDDRILLTVSGGVDSMVMLDLFVAAGYRVGVAHCNFQLRGEESDEDEVLVETRAAGYGVPFYNKRFDTQHEMEITGDSVQIAARRLRYEWFRQLSDAHGYDAVAIAHHADDSIETFFINLMRGTGLKGLTGIHKVNGRIIRPLLFASRREILDYAVAHRIPYREDSSNRSTKYLRNKIRLGIIPLLRGINPNFTELMGANISRLTDAQLFIDRCIESIHDQAVTPSTDGIATIDPSRIDPKLPLNYVIYELMSAGYGFKGDVTDDLFEALRRNATGRRFYSKGYFACIDRGRIVVAPITDDDPCETELPETAHKTYCGNHILTIEHTDIDNIDSLRQPANVALLDADRLQWPLRLRRWHEGDAFVPFGLTASKKVSDFLINEKVSLPEKKRQFVLLNGEEIVWVVGRRIDDRYKITAKTENILKLRCEEL